MPSFQGENWFTSLYCASPQSDLLHPFLTSAERSISNFLSCDSHVLIALCASTFTSKWRPRYFDSVFLLSVTHQHSASSLAIPSRSAQISFPLHETNFRNAFRFRSWEVDLGDFHRCCCDATCGYLAVLVLVVPNAMSGYRTKKALALSFVQPG